MKKNLNKIVSLLMLCSLFSNSLSAHNRSEIDNIELDYSTDDTFDDEDLPKRKKDVDMASQIINYNYGKKKKKKKEISKLPLFIAGGAGLATLIGIIYSKLSGKFCFKNDIPNINTDNKKDDVPDGIILNKASKPIVNNNSVVTKPQQDVTLGNNIDNNKEKSYKIDEFVEDLESIIGDSILNEKIFKSWLESAIYDKLGFFEADDSKLKNDDYGFARFNDDRGAVFNENDGFSCRYVYNEKLASFLEKLSVFNIARVGTTGRGELIRGDNTVASNSVISMGFSGLRTLAFGVRVKGQWSSDIPEENMVWFFRTKNGLMMRDHRDRYIALDLKAAKSGYIAPAKGNSWNQLCNPSQAENNNTLDIVSKCLK